MQKVIKIISVYKRQNPAKKDISRLEYSVKQGVEFAVFVVTVKKQYKLLIRAFFVYHHFYLPLYESTYDIVQC